MDSPRAHKLVLRHDSTPWHRKSTRHLLRQASTQFERRRERERERKCASTSMVPGSTRPVPTHDASICVHTRSQHALHVTRQAQTRESHLTENHGYWGPHPVTSSSLTRDCRQIQPRSITAPTSGIQLTPECWHTHGTHRTTTALNDICHRDFYLRPGYLKDLYKLEGLRESVDLSHTRAEFGRTV